MPNETTGILVDASYLVALGYPHDRNHEKAKTFATIHKTGLLIPDVVLVEAIYDLQRLGGTAAMVRFSNLLATQAPQFVPLSVVDFARAVALIAYGREGIKKSGARVNAGFRMLHSLESIRTQHASEPRSIPRLNCLP